jgi:hypothetical protein
MKYILYLFAFACLVFGAGIPAMASHDSGVGEEGDESSIGGADHVTIENPLEAENITQLFASIIDVVLVFAIPIIVFFIIYAGFLYVTARGNESTIQKAHMALLYALIGGLLILGARVLIDVVKGTVEQVTGEETSEI